MQDLKMKDQISGHENAGPKKERPMSGHENVGPANEEPNTRT